MMRLTCNHRAWHKNVTMFNTTIHFAEDHFLKKYIITMQQNIKPL